jgi:hypothetical protein
LNGDLSILKTLPDGQRLNAMKALSAYAKFSGSYEQYKRLIKAFGLKWSVNNDDIIISRLLKYSSNSETQSELFDWIQKVRSQIPAFKIFMDFIIATGLRLDEVINSYKLIVDLSRKENFVNITILKDRFLSTSVFKEIFIRKTKKTFFPLRGPNFGRPCARP